MSDIVERLRDIDLIDHLENLAPVCAVIAEAADEIERLEAERDEADRRAGAAERRLAYEEDTNRKRRTWTDRAKEEAGYHRNVSFDTVWRDLQTIVTAARAYRDTVRHEMTPRAGNEMDVEAMRRTRDDLFAAIDALPRLEPGRLSDTKE
jgi:hypothetical protein